jgi:hypothetical protein
MPSLSTADTPPSHIRNASPTGAQRIVELEIIVASRCARSPTLQGRSRNATQRNEPSKERHPTARAHFRPDLERPRTYHSTSLFPARARLQRCSVATRASPRPSADPRYVPFARNKIEDGLKHGKAWLIHWLGGVEPAGTYAHISEYERIAAGNVERESRDSRYRFDPR